MINVLSIGGIDPCTYSGVSADLKTFISFNVQGRLVTTAVTAQNSHRFKSFIAVPVDSLKEQLETVFDEVKISAVKTGLLTSPEQIKIISRFLSKYSIPIVVDPVLKTTTGKSFFSENLKKAYLSFLLQAATIVLPNRHEFTLLSENNNERNDIEAASNILKYGVKSILVKGGHSEGAPNDFLFYWDNEKKSVITKCFSGQRILGVSWRGLGGALSAAITALLANGYSIIQAITLAKRYVAAGMERTSLSLYTPSIIHPYEETIQRFSENRKEA